MPLRPDAAARAEAAVRGGRPARRRISPQGTVVAAGLSVALLLLLAMSWLTAAEYRASLDRSEQHTRLLARVFADQVGRNVDAAALAVGTLDELLARGIVPTAPEMQTTLAQSLVNLPYLRGMAVLDPDGRVLAAADGRTAGVRVDAAALGPLPPQGQTRLGGFVPGRDLRDLGLADGATRAPAGVGFVPLLRVAVWGDQPVLIVALLNVDAFVTAQLLAMADAPMAAALTTLDGELLAATPGVADVPGTGRPQLAPFTRFLPQREDGSWRGQGLRAAPQIASFRLTRTWPLAAVVETGRAEAEALAWRSVRGLLAAGLGMVAMTLLLTLVAARNVRERMQAQALVAARERELSETLDRLEELVFRCDADGRLRFVNGAWLRLLGGAAAHWHGRPLLDVPTPATRPALAALLERPDTAGGGTVRVALRARDGQARSFDLSLRPLPGVEQGYAGSAIDVSAQVAAQRRLQEQLAFTEQLLQSSPLPLSVVGRDGLYRMVNQAWERLTGTPRQAAVGQPVGRHLPPEARRQHETHDAVVYATARPQRYEARVPDAEGQLRDVLVEKLPLPGLDGGVDAILNVVVDVSEFRAAERATREARDAAEDASRAKTEFIANISHELRTPLQSIIGFSELGQRRAGEQPRLQAMFGDIHAAGHRMLALVNDLLDVARIESSAGTLHLERVDLRLPVRELLAELAPLAAQRGVDLVDLLPATPMPVKIDPLRLQQVVRNVVANALRFSPKQGVVEVRGQGLDDGQWRLTVADRGPGIPEAELERIFDAFVQSSRTKDGSGGTGLGLAISRTIMQAHGGQIVARNRVGGGAEFDIVLPPAPQPGLTAALSVQ